MKEVASVFHGLKTPVAAWFGPMMVVGIAEPDDMQTVLSSDECLTKGYMYRFMNNKTGIFTSEDIPTWRQHRRLLGTSFNPTVLQSFVPVFNEKSRIMCKRMAVRANTSGRNGCNIYKFVFLCALDITVRE